MSKLVSSRRIRPSRRPERRGAIVVLFAVFIIPVIACVVFAIDVGYLNLVRTELQRAADSGALAGAAGMYPEITSLESFSFTIADPDAARPAAQKYVKYNGAGPYDGVSNGSTYLLADLNLANDPAGDIVLGRFNVPSDLSEPFTPTMISPNTVQVRATLAEGHANGPLSMFFAGVLGFQTANVGATATATVEYATLLPFTTSVDKWATLATGGDGDSYNYSPGNVTSGGDSVPEIVIFPSFQWDGVGMPPGNFGALKIGPKSGTIVLRYQIDSGPTQTDLAYHGGTLRVGMVVPGETGIKADVDTAFAGGTADGRKYPGIIGKVRVMPLYRYVEGNGANARFEIAKFVMVRIMDARIKGNSKRVVIQPLVEGESTTNVYLSR